MTELDFTAATPEEFSKNAIAAVEATELSERVDLLRQVVGTEFEQPFDAYLRQEIAQAKQAQAELTSGGSSFCGIVGRAALATPLAYRVGKLAAIHGLLEKARALGPLDPPEVVRDGPVEQLHAEIDRLGTLSADQRHAEIRASGDYFADDWTWNQAVERMRALSGAVKAAKDGHFGKTFSEGPAALQDIMMQGMENQFAATDAVLSEMEALRAERQAARLRVARTRSAPVAGAVASGLAGAVTPHCGTCGSALVNGYCDTCAAHAAWNENAESAQGILSDDIAKADFENGLAQQQIEQADFDRSVAEDHTTYIDNNDYNRYD
jgi:hypothetical protein